MKSMFILASCLELAMGMVEMCKYEVPGKRIVLWGFFFIYLLTALCNKYSQKEKVVFGVVVLLGVVLYMQSGINTGIKAPVYILALKEMDIKKLFRYMSFTMIFMFGIIFFMAIFFGFGTLYFCDVRKNRGFQGLRYCFGFSHPNMFQIAFYGVLSYGLFAFGDRMSWKKWACIMMFYMGISFFTNSLTGMLVGAVTGLGVLLARKVRISYLPEIIMGVSGCMLGCYIVVSFLAAMDVEKGLLMNTINKLISGRMNQLQLYTNDEIYVLPQIENWTLFASRSHKNVYDMGYVQIFYYYGILMASCYLGFVVCALNEARRRRDSLGMVLIMGLCMYLFMEARYFSNYLTRDFLLMVSAGVMWGNNEKNISSCV